MWGKHWIPNEPGVPHLVSLHHPCISSIVWYLAKCEQNTWTISGKRRTEIHKSCMLWSKTVFSGSNITLKYMKSHLLGNILMFLLNLNWVDSVSIVSVPFILCFLFYCPAGDRNITALELLISRKCWDYFKPNKYNEYILNPVVSHGSLYIVGAAELLTSSTSTPDSSVQFISTIHKFSLFHSVVLLSVWFFFLSFSIWFLYEICILISFLVYLIYSLALPICSVSKLCFLFCCWSFGLL